MATTISKTLRRLSRREKHAILLSILFCNCCNFFTSVSALQSPKKQSRSLLPSPSIGSFKATSSKGIKRRRERDLSLSSSLNTREQDLENEILESTNSPGMNRREVFSNSAKALFAGLSTPFVLNPTDPANAVLIRFPIGAYNTQDLKNTYHFIRAGTSELEIEGIYSTNPLFLTNRENALSDEGYKALKPALRTLKETSMAPTVAYHSLAANGMDTGDYIARELKLARDRLLPEFTYLDQRGIGLWDSSDESLVRKAVWAMDSMEAGTEGLGGRPPANTDGTPNDTLHDQFTRLRQFLSLQETRTSGEIILVIFPDGTGPALLSCMIAGIPYSEAHALEFKPGELRLDITPESVKELYEARKDDPEYLAIIEEGKENLKELRSMKSADFGTSFKDSQANEKQEAENVAAFERQKAAALEKQKVEEERRAAIQEQIRISKEKKQAQEDERKKAENALKEKKNEKVRAERERQEKKKAEGQAAYVAKKQEDERRKAEAKEKIADSQAAAKLKYEETQAATKKAREEKFETLKAQKQAGTTKSVEVVSSSTDSPSIFGMSPTVLATAAVGALGAVFLVGGDDEDETKDYSAVATKNDGSGDGNNASKTNSATTAAVEKNPVSHATEPLSIEKKTLHVPAANVTSHVPAANATSLKTSPKEIHVQKKTTQVTVSNTADETLVHGSARNAVTQNSAAKAANPDKSVKTKKKGATLKPLTSARKNEDKIENQSISPLKKNKKPKVKPLTSARKKEESNEGSETTKTHSASTAKKGKPKLKPLTNAREQADLAASKIDSASAAKKGRPKLKPRQSTATQKNTFTKINAKDPEKEFTSKLQAAEQEMKNAFVEAADVKKKKEQESAHLHQPQKSPPKTKSSLFDNNPPVIVTKTAPTKTTNYVYDDDVDDSDWLRVLSEIRDEVKDDDDDDDFGMVDYTTLMNDAQY